MTVERFIAAFGEQVRRLRELAGRSQLEVARAGHTSQSFVSRLERGELDIHFRNVLGVARALADVVPQLQGAVPTPLARTILALADHLDAAPAMPLEPGFATLLRTYHALTPPRRAAFVRVVLPIAALCAELPAPEHAA